jgi:hypothetical protein
VLSRNLKGIRSFVKPRLDIDSGTAKLFFHHQIVPDAKKGRSPDSDRPCFFLSISTAGTVSELNPRTSYDEVEVSKVGTRPGEHIDVD